MHWSDRQTEDTCIETARRWHQAGRRAGEQASRRAGRHCSETDRHRGGRGRQAGRCRRQSAERGGSWRGGTGCPVRKHHLYCLSLCASVCVCLRVSACVSVSLSLRAVLCLSVLSTDDQATCTQLSSGGAGTSERELKQLIWGTIVPAPTKNILSACLHVIG